ncbi:hypothetical protein [Paracidovorax oryzae]|uniref:hypothetical protein n=1 Tax=Paracidovorax oryzae TaxID=862720 RepID=UPI00047ECB32|nr:hypothetical protein [Paracidovorax oryzae]
MLLPHDDAMQFIEAYEAVLTQVLINEGKKLTRSLIKDLAKARNLVKADMGRLHRAMEMVKSTSHGLPSQIERVLPTMRAGRWFYLRSTTRYALMLDADLKNAYAVKGLTTPLHELLSGTTVVVETAIFEYKGEFVCDGIIADPVYIGPGIRADLNATYTTIKAEGRFHKRCAG